MCSYIRVTVDDVLAGHAFACYWRCDHRSVCWITQLVVHRDYRERGLATGMLRELKRDRCDVYGVMSSHPAACLALAKTFPGAEPPSILPGSWTLTVSGTIGAVPLSFIGDNAEAILQSSPVDYVKSAKLCGSLFNSGDASGVVSCADTGFFVDRTEPLEVLAWVRENMDWPLGDLIDGHGFLLILEVKHRAKRTLS